MLTKNALLTGAGLGLAALAGADFTLTAPAAIETKGNGTIPCGDYDALDREKETDWPVLGHDVGVNTNDPWSTFTFRAALADDLTKFVTLRPAVHHGRAGDFCFMRIRGVKDWVGKKAVVEVRQYTGGGEYDYGCAAVTFVEGGPAPPACRGFHEQLVANHERRIAEKAKAGQEELDQNEEARLAVQNRFEQRDLDIRRHWDNTARAAVGDDVDDDDDGDDDDDDDDDSDVDLGQETPKSGASMTPVSTYTHMHAIPDPSGSVAYSSPPLWAHNQTAPMPTGHADMPSKTPGAGPTNASPAPGGHELTPMPESEAAGFSRGFVLLNLGLVTSLVALFSL